MLGTPPILCSPENIMSTLNSRTIQNACRLALALAPLSVLGAVLMPHVSGAPAAASVTVGDPAHPEGLAQALQDAYTGGAHRIVIRPGVYLMPNVGHTAITLQGWQNTTISAYGVTLILTDLTWPHDGFNLNGCTNVTLAGVLLSQNQITSYQGRVIAVGKDAAGKPYCDWRPDKGYPVPPDTDKGFLGGDANVVDAHTRRLKIGDGDFYGVKYEPNGDGTFRAQMGGNIAIGDWLVGRYGNAPFKVHVVNSHDCTIRDVAMIRNGFAPLREEGGGGNHYLHDIWKLGPRPTGATEYPLVTNAADGMHMTNAYPGPDIEDCVMTGVFLDDCIAIHGYFSTVTSVSGNMVTVKGGAGEMVVGQPIRVSDQKGFYGQANVTAIKDNGDGTTTATLDQSLDIPTDAKLSNPLQNGAGYKIIGCQIGDTRSRGILAKADNGVIKNNRIIGCGMSAVSLGPEYSWGEADYVHHVRVEDNLIEGNGKAGYGGAACLIHGDGAIGNQDITVHDNRFVGNDQGDFDVQWADGVTIADNTLIGATPWPATIPAQTMMSFTNVKNITLQGNVVHDATVYRAPLVAVGANVTRLTNNDASGVRTAEGLSK
jgi:hypothetical protein